MKGKSRVEVRVDPGGESGEEVGRKVFSKRTLVYLGIGLGLVGLAAWRAPINWGEAWSLIRKANIGFYILALGFYYFSFVVRSLRWEALLANAKEDRRWTKLIGILISSYFLNCVLPGKMGDVYRAYLAKVKLRVSTSKALGTVVAERLIDLCVLMLLLLGAGGVVFWRRAPGVLVPYVAVGIAICLMGVGVILTMRAGRGQRLIRLLPDSAFHHYEGFRQGAVSSMGRFPLLLLESTLIWGLEAGRLGMVVLALGFGGRLGPAPILLIALFGALLTTIPFLPGGLGLVEAGMVGILIAVGGVNNQGAVAITLLDRSISYGSLVAIGFVVFLVTQARKSQVKAVQKSEEGLRVGGAPMVKVSPVTE